MESEARLVDENQTNYGSLARADMTLRERVHSVPLPRLGVVLHVREIGAASGPALVLLHGVFSDGRTWRFVTSLLAETYRVLVVDLPGCGRSRGPDPRVEPSTYSIAWLGRVVLEGLERLVGSETPVVFIGHSLGANVALSALRRAHREADGSPVAPGFSGALLIAPADPLAEEYPRVLRELACLSGWEISLGAAVGVLDARIEAAVRRSVELPDERAFLAEAARLRACLTDAPLRRASQAMLQRFPRNQEEVGLLPRGSTLLLWGSEDDVLPVDIGRRLSRRLGDAPLAMVPGARHSVHQEAPAAVALEIRRFVWERLDARRRRF
jgi:pimeloyl-ACP methyl ester carboxylesterase